MEGLEPCIVVEEALVIERCHGDCCQTLCAERQRLRQICNIELKPGEDVGEGVGGVGGVPAAPEVDHLESGSLPWQNPNVERKVGKTKMAKMSPPSLLPHRHTVGRSPLAPCW